MSLVVKILVTWFQIRPLFEEHGNVLEVALIKDKRTGQQQGMCKYYWFWIDCDSYQISLFRSFEGLMGAPVILCFISVSFSSNFQASWFLVATFLYYLTWQPRGRQEKTSNIPLCIMVGNMEDTDLALVLLAAAVGALSNMSILMEVSIYILCSFFFPCHVWKWIVVQQVKQQ